MPATKKTDDLEPAKTAVEAQIEEATTDPATAEVTVDFNGGEYTFRRRRLNSAEWITLVQEGSLYAALKWLLGDRQYTRLVAANAGEDGWQLEDSQRFIEALGVTLGGKA